MATLRFILNGEPRVVDGVPPTMTVLDWLRNVARLTGTKEGCAEGDCGACTIALRAPGAERGAYQAVNSCLMMLPQLDGYEVLTVEGLSAPGGPLHAVQQALVNADATQCGFCTPGFVMAMFAMRQDGERAGDAEIHEALAGNLCRCTGYRSIVEACRRVLSAPAEPGPVGAIDIAWSGTDYNTGGQTFLAPRSFDDLFAAMRRHPDALLLAGGTDLGLRVSKDREALPVVVSTAAVAGMKAITAAPDALEIGGAATYSEMLPHLDRHFPAFGALVRRLGSRQIRNLGTLAGNLATASPIGDTLPCLIALNATVTLRAVNGLRSLKVEDFITGYRQTALRPGEVIAAISIPYLQRGERFVSYKLSKRFDQDIATVVATFHLTLRGGRVAALRAAFGGMAPRAMRAAETEAWLLDRAWTNDTLRDIESVLARDFTPISDHRGGAGYRLRAAAGLLRRFQIETTAPVLTRVEAL
jgi:xanthine dehydrogenase small subunit